MILNRRFGRLPEGHDPASSGPCKGPGVGGNRRERSQGRWSEWRRDQQVGGSRPGGWRERFFSRPPGGSTGHREPTWVPGSPAVRDPSPGQSGNSSLPGYQLCAHHLLSNYYMPSPVLGGSGPPHPWEERAMPTPPHPRPQRPGEVASAVSCHPAGQLVSARPSAFPPPGFPVCAALAQLHLQGTPWRVGGSAFLRQTLELPMGPGQAPLPPPALNIWLGGRRLRITGGQGGLRVTAGPW